MATKLLTKNKDGLYGNGAKWASDIGQYWMLKQRDGTWKRVARAHTEGSRRIVTFEDGTVEGFNRYYVVSRY